MPFLFVVSYFKKIIILHSICIHRSGNSLKKFSFEKNKRKLADWRVREDEDRGVVEFMLSY